MKWVSYYSSSRHMPRLVDYMHAYCIYFATVKPVVDLTSVLLGSPSLFLLSREFKRVLLL